MVEASALEADQWGFESLLVYVGCSSSAERLAVNQKAAGAAPASHPSGPSSGGRATG